MLKAFRVGHIDVEISEEDKTVRFTAEMIHMKLVLLVFTILMKLKS